MKTWPVLAILLLSLATALPAHADGLSPAASKALAQLLERGRQTHSNAVLVLQNGHELGHYYPNDKAPGPIELMSVTKSVVALGIGQLLDQGRIKSLDQPVADFYPEWKQGRKRDITLRMLLDHTSGLQNFPRTDVEIYPAPDAVQLALTAELSSKPGTSASYNNKAVNLLAGIIEKASGQPMDVFFRDGLFKAMDIHAGPWEKDKTGHPYAMAGLKLTAADLAKLGQLVLDRGRWQGRPLLPAGFIDGMLAPASMEGECGLLWWRATQWTHFSPNPASFDMLRERGVPESTVRKLQNALKDARFDSTGAMQAGIAKALGPDAKAIMVDQLVKRGIGPYRLFKVSHGPIVAYDGNGDGGQYVVVVPRANLVAVRQIDAGGETESADQGYDDFINRVITVAEASGRLPPPPHIGTR
ncbi:beta-lactamase family protein [Rhodanobacter denitrificans]|uniref:serine hydrolase domain-containing protein n=1 Tax=Rhodanobacter denitrificans TaxID=666685 RepID=UPI000260CC98|nr:serine hydrolase [Rhodanobacter denitrificans]EIM00010.1 6-aminohexanoate-dimer hydrolase [Rhodanobacter denitrificans]UJM91295.1 beta-lactamase family protein [Rhodanobacter denitrificans]